MKGRIKMVFENFCQHLLSAREWLLGIYFILTLVFPLIGGFIGFKIFTIIPIPFNSVKVLGGILSAILFEGILWYLSGGCLTFWSISHIFQSSTTGLTIPPNITI